MDIQEIIVAIIVGFCILRVALRIVRYFKRIKNNNSSCGCCCSGCALKETHGASTCCCKKIEEKSRKS
ncbi:MAG: FeoB-associated Cys-rich membrane protein [Bacteroidales bacterium]|nr:FeoB-associated Cys-rich membrane protein [Bacteroidales bacterium]